MSWTTRPGWSILVRILAVGTFTGSVVWKSDDGFYYNMPTFRYPELKDKVECEKIPDHFIFSVESVGANAPDDLVSMAWDVLIEKCDYFIAELNMSANKK